MPKSFAQDFEFYIKGKKIKDLIYHYPYGDMRLPAEQRYYGQGIVTDDGYKYLSFGGGCSGEDCNTSYIVDPFGVLISAESW